MSVCKPLSQRPRVYSPLRRDGTEVRVLLLEPGIVSDTVSCRLQHVDLNGTFAYKALSYTWGDASQTRLILVDGKLFPVTVHLADALTSLRTTSHPISVWADAICINQLDVTEVNLMVSRMKSIYEGASEVVVWLGMEGPNDAKAVHFIKELHDHWRSDGWWEEASSSSDADKQISGIHSLLTRDYWSRTWVVQETMFNQNITVQCGSLCFPWSQLNFAKITEKRSAELEKFPGTTALGVLRLMRNSISANPGDPGFEGIATVSDLLRTLIWYRQLAATDPKDKVYAFIGLLSAACPVYSIDYGLTTQEVFINTARYIITATESLDILSVTPTAQNTLQLPSWVPDWRRQPDSTSVNLLRLRAGDPLFSASGTIQGDWAFSSNGEVLCVKGIQIARLQTLGVPCRVESMTQDQSHQESAFRSFLDWYELLSQHVGCEEEHIDNFFRILSCDYTCSANASGAINQTPREAALDAISDIVSTAHELGLLHSVPESLRLLVSQHSSLGPGKKNRISTIFMQDRRFFVTSAGLMGLVPARAQESDTLCIVLGCRQPLVLRKMREGYRVIGEAFVHGLMYGEWVKNDLSEMVDTFDLV